MTQVQNIPIQTRAEAINNQLIFFSWRAAFSGTLIAILAFTVLMTLGMAIGSVAASDLEGFTTLGWSAAIWTIAAAMIALFAGSFAANRVSGFVTNSVSLIQSGVVAALFFLATFFSGGMLLGSLGGAITGTASAMLPNNLNLSSMSNSQMVSQEIYDMTQGFLVNELGVDPSEVDTLVSRSVSLWINEGAESAKDYIASETDIDPAQVSAAIEQIQNTANTRLTSFAKASTQAFAAAGWFTFLLLVLSIGSSMFGGWFGSRRNQRRPIEEQEMEIHKAA